MTDDQKEYLRLAALEIAATLAEPDQSRHAAAPSAIRARRDAVAERMSQDEWRKAQNAVEHAVWEWV
jgi:hypothetical protein